MSTGFPNYNVNWPMVHQSPYVFQGPGVLTTDCLEISRAFENGTSYVFSDPAEEFSSCGSNTAPTSIPFPSPPSPPANGGIAHGVGNPGYQHPPIPQLTAPSPASGISSLTPTYIKSSPTVLALAENGELQPYQCLGCPNMPAFGSHKDLERHRITSKAHWSTLTRFYRCCCGAYDRPRKDHHLRHVQGCDAQALIPYTCICGKECCVRDEHLEHVMNCGRIRRRRQSAAP
ncbi:hypothetical protein F5Y19DRAFT_411619 [Xylariaceae sp. FL1651]|nr:hypothetical protein F5Y19DRAFT_411619 [Xylariaceae sp. FL1651]